MGKYAITFSNRMFAYERKIRKRKVSREDFKVKEKEEDFGKKSSWNYEIQLGTLHRRG